MSVKYWKVTGRLVEGSQLLLRKGHLSPLCGSWQEPENSRVEVAFVAADGVLLARRRLSLLQLSVSRGRFPSYSVQGSPLFPEETVLIRMLLDGTKVLEAEVAKTDPVVSIKSELEGEVSGEIVVRWQVKHVEDHETECFLLYSRDSGNNWIRISGRIDGSETVVDFDRLAGGEDCALRVVATDGIRTGYSDVGGFSVRPRAYVPMIMLPVPDAVFRRGNVVTFRGVALGVDTRDLVEDEVLWESNVDGELGRGQSIERELSVGSHVVTMSVGSGEDRCSAGVPISVIDAAIEAE
jgi:hypothetical protein